MAGVEPPRDRGRIVDNIPEAAVRAQLAQIVASPTFSRASRMQRFLSFLVEERLAGRGDQLKEYTIAIAVFDKPVDFDPGTSAVIRVEAGRLRRMLDQYRARSGSDDSLVFEIPKGSYIPVFERTSHLATPAEGSFAPADPGLTWPTTDERRLITAVSCAFSDERRNDGPVDAGFLNAFEIYHEISCAIAARHGGAVESSASDRILIHFGWPEAVEDGAGRALTAALEIIEASAASFAREARGLRIGVATSDVIIRAGPTDSKGGPRIIGPAPALASTIATDAPLNGVLVADSTRRLAGQAFEFVPAGDFAAEDGGQPLLWRLIGRRASMTRFRAERGTDETAIVGRRDEIGLLLGKWRLALGGESQVVALVGEAGIGKSILSEAALARMECASVLRLQCSPHHTNSSLYPFIELLRQMIPLSEECDNEELAFDFLAAVGLDGPQERSLLAGLLSRFENNPIDSLPASQQKDLTLRLLARWVAARVEREPAVLLVEDLHWSDPTTLELLQDIARSLASQRLLMLLTSRADVSETFLEHNVTSLRLARLPKADCETLITKLASTADIAAAARDAILRRAEGIPLFIEELTRLCLGTAAWRSEAQIPVRLSDLLGSQLSRLGSARGVAQVAAVMGRRFSREMLAVATGHSEEEVDSALDRLQAAGVITRLSTGEQESYQFRHALLRDAAYESVLDQPRRELHRKVAAILIESFPDSAARHPEVVAGHLTDAGDFAEALPFWVDAGEGAARRYALAEASNAYRLALDALARLPDTSANSDRELDVLIALGQVVRSAHGYGSEELLSIYSRARAIAARKSNRRQLANAVYGLWTHAAGQGRWPDAVAIAAEFEELTKHSGNCQLDIEAQRLLGASAAFRGEFQRARAHFSRAMEIYEIDRHGPDYGFDPGAASAAYLTWILWHLGDEDAARKNVGRALAIAEAKEHAPTLAMVLSWVIFHAVCDHDIEAIRRFNDRLQTVCTERECRYWQPFGSACREWADFEIDGDPAHLERLLSFTKAFRERYFTSSLLLLAAGIGIRQGASDVAMNLIEDARRFMKQHDERLWEAEADRLAAECLLRSSPADHEKPERLLMRAIGTARRQGAVVLERRASSSLATLVPPSGISNGRVIQGGRPEMLH